MLNRLAKLLLILSSLAPILLTWAFADWKAVGPDQRQAWALLVVLLLVISAWTILRIAGAKGTKISFRTASVKPADQEIVGFLLAYLLPLISSATGQLDYETLAVIAVLLAIVVWSSNAYSVNPLLNLFRYHFYEVSNADGVTFLMISRRQVLSAGEVNSVIQLARYLLLDPKTD